MVSSTIAQVVLAIAGAVATGVVGVIVFRYKRGVTKEDIESGREEDRLKDLEKKIEVIPALTQKLTNLEKTIPNLVKKTDLDVLQKEIQSGFIKLNGAVEEIREDSESFVGEIPDKYQTKEMCQQNVKAMLSTVKRTEDDVKYVRGRIDTLADHLMEKK